ncbi:MAG TPA: CBS domain-containing protein [Candidatus Methanoculleus thermohydrogenotrophicum]|jgi:CBS domain-containing protein|nr:CBS domain-containing protein [Candidatus Methanoculleus thermohydrogenotrophicum]NLM81596.1 CBS domain-containing protein [Candidatus Methanoculleus thermohydrogenotrophicum]HOB17101.1 CBS domain-containing protein [Candidatus Methanoculleus thermohydrogenotrophicum]HPZ37181.1 CBS domain-containing protein [Candidatus Methanoculleus thermohydrogenotrophicum]HQC90604.1 CBS domain-containing protein [Candidatus Methanoculleus thermohydrogenotrophicum]
MDASLQIGNLVGIPVRLHWSFLLVIPLFAWIIGSQIELTAELIAILFGVPIDLTLILVGFNSYVLGTIVALGLFGGVLVHELAHSLIAKAKGIKIHGITLFILGGVAQMEEIMPDPRVELPMALAGPLASLAIGLICGALVYVFRAVIPDPAVVGVLIFVFGYLALLNVLLFGFNLLPAFPMDGGRVLRAWLARRMPLYRATRIAADVGKMFAVLFGIIGFLLLNPILVLIAFFIYIGASQEATYLRYNILLQDVTVADAMSSPVITVEPTMPLSRVIEMMYETKHLGFPVVERGSLVGIITLADVHKVSPIDREAMQVRDVMTANPITLPPSASLLDALRIMSSQNIGRVPVVVDDTLVGIVTRTDVLRVMELRERM